MAPATYSQSDCYPAPPPELLNNITIASQSIAASGVDALDSRLTRIVALAIADALGGDISGRIKQLEAYRYLGETARTDKQVGASAKANGSTSAAEKPGIISLLGFAIEHGAIQQEVDGTNLTLSTSPYAFIALAKGDSPETYQKAGLFNRIGLSATFNISDENNVLVNVTKKQLSEYSAKLRLSGDRSTRSEAFQRFWDQNIATAITARLDANQDLTDIVANDPQIIPLIRPGIPGNARDKLRAQITSYLSLHPTTTQEQQNTAVPALSQLILCAIKTAIFDPVRAGNIKFSQATIDEINDSVNGLAAAHAKLAEARVKLEKFLKDFQKMGTVSTFAFTNHRTEMGSDYGEFKFLFERHVAPVDLVANFGLTLYWNPNTMLNQEKVRDAFAAISLEGSSDSPFADISQDLSRLTYAFTYRYQRFQENKDNPERQPDLHSFQAKLEIPITLGLRIPVAYTYSSATETSPKKESRFNIGLTLDLDKILASKQAK